jgi:hypothetical protein
MAKGKISEGVSSQKNMRPAISPENEEGQCISLAMSLVKKRLMEGTASSQETTHFLRLASSETQLKKKLLATQAELMQAKKQAIESEEKKEALFADAINAMKKYSGNGGSDEDEEY